MVESLANPKKHLHIYVIWSGSALYNFLVNPGLPIFIWLTMPARISYSTYIHTYKVYLDTAVGTLQDLTICQSSGKLTCGWAPIVVTAAASPFPPFSFSFFSTSCCSLLNRFVGIGINNCCTEDYRKSIIAFAIKWRNGLVSFFLFLLFKFAIAIEIQQRAPNLMCILFNSHIIVCI